MLSHDNSSKYNFLCYEMTLVRLNANKLNLLENYKQ